MNHDLTTNARVLPVSLDKLRQLKQALGFKTIYQTVEYVVDRAIKDPVHKALLQHWEEYTRLSKQRYELQSQLLS